MQKYAKRGSLSSLTDSPNGSGSGPDSLPLDSYGTKPWESGNRGEFEGYKAEHSHKVTARFTPMKRRARGMARYIAGKVQGLPIGSLERGKLEGLEKEVRLCRNSLLFKDHYLEERVTLSKMKSCKRDKLCPLCGVARANGCAVSYGRKTEQLLSEGREEGIELRLYFVTITKRHGVDLGNTYNAFAQSVSRLSGRRQDAIRARRGSKAHSYALGSVMGSVTAGVFSFETKRGKADTTLWNVHAHGLLLSTEPIDKGRLSNEWRAITGDSFIVDIQEIRTDSRELLGKALCEVMKYALKFSELSLEDNYTAAMELKGRNLLRSFGAYRGLVPDDNADIDDTTLLDSPYVEMLYTYRVGAYVRIPTDGTTILPTPYKRDLTPMMLRQYGPDFVPGIVVGEHAITARSPLTFEVDSSA